MPLMVACKITNNTMVGVSRRACVCGPEEANNCRQPRGDCSTTNVGSWLLQAPPAPPPPHTQHCVLLFCLWLSMNVLKCL